MRCMIGMYEKGLFMTFVVGLALLIIGSSFTSIGRVDKRCESNEGSE